MLHVLYMLCVYRVSYNRQHNKLLHVLYMLSVYSVSYKRQHNKCYTCYISYVMCL